MSDYELNETSTATADANGKAVARLQPLRAFEDWHVSHLTVSSTSTVLVPTLKVYRGSEVPSALVDGTYNGQLNHSDTNLTVRNGETLMAVWEGADVGSFCTFKVQGTKKGRT